MQDDFLEPASCEIDDRSRGHESAAMLPLDLSDDFDHSSGNHEPASWRRRSRREARSHAARIEMTPA